MKALLALLLAAAACGADVPKEYQIALGDVQWLTTERGKLYWRDGGYDAEHPDRIGVIQERQVLWNKKIYPITSFTKVMDRKVVIQCELGTLTLKHWEGRMWLVELTPKSGAKEIFRTDRSHWPDDMRAADWDPETATGLKP